MTEPASWTVPSNVRVGENTRITGDRPFKRFQGVRSDALVIGSDSTMDNVQFAVGPDARIKVGSHCYFTSTVLLAELEVVIGDFVVIGWNVTIADTDFHPLDPALRIADARALSPLGAGRTRPAIERRAVVIEDDVWIGPSVVVLKGVRIGAGAFVEPGAVVTRDVRPGARVLGNPAREVQG